MERRHLSPFQRRARQLLGQPAYSHVEGARALGRSPQRFLAIAYTGVRRPCVCAGCICLTSQERARQRRVFALVRAVTRAYGPGQH